MKMAREALDRYNKDVLSNLSKNEAGELKGNVCVLCDKLMAGMETCYMTIDTLAKYSVYAEGDSNLPETLRQQYTFTVQGDEARTKALSKCLLSPRASVRKKKNKKHWAVTCCVECKAGWNKRALATSIPKRAIANNMAIGVAPSCLQDLTEIELALVSQARFRGHMFTYWGGCHRSIKGWHSFYDVNPGHTVGVLNEVCKLTEKDNICVVLSGPFTVEQKEKVMKKTRVRVEKVMEALEWLKQNNHLYKDVVIPTMGDPVVVDNTEEVESESSDIEIREEIRVVFPDSSAKIGGQEDTEQMKKAIADLRCKLQQGEEPFVVSRPSCQQRRDYQDDNLMRAFPLQFPYGHGFSDDEKEKCHQSDHLAHLSRLSIPAFHEAPFLVAAHNMFERQKALQGSIWQVMGRKQTCDLSEEDLNQAIRDHCNGTPSTNGPGKAFMSSLKAVKKNMAHTNQAAQANQAKFISLSHHFGCAKAMLTVSFDDGLDIRIAALSGKENIESWLDNMDGISQEDQSIQMSELNAIRLKYPGLCALNFEWLLKAVLNHIVGDNDLKEGIFGTLEAYGAAVEEQGRKTLHAHILIYCKGWNSLLQALNSNSKMRKHAAEAEIKKFVDTVISTELIPDTAPNMCPICNERSLQVKDNQSLRNLRHKVGCWMENPAFIDCLNCNRSFTGDELAKTRVLGPRSLEWDEAWVMAHMNRSVLMQSFGITPHNRRDKVGIVNLRYNNHLSHHTKTCFKKGDEGRCCLPDIPEEETRVHFKEETTMIFDWRGREVHQDSITIRPKRLPQDAYTNAYCKLMSQSVTPCNSNVSVTTGARSTTYASCYSSKGTQKEDSEDFRKVGKYAAARWKETRKESPLFEGLSRLMGAVMVNTSEHICSAPMASYILRNGSRFTYSHTFKYVPLRETMDVLCNTDGMQSLKMSVMTHEDGCFLHNDALNYLLRPQSFNHTSMLEFFEEYEVVRHNDKMKDVIDLDDESHPGHGKEVVRQRKLKVLAQFPQWIFADSATFAGDIMQIPIGTANSQVEKQSLAILMLFVPFRSKDDLQVGGSFHTKLRHLGSTIPDKVINIMTNVQMFHNSTKLPGKHDPLNANTNPYKCPGKNSGCEESDEEEDDDVFFDGMFDFMQRKSTSDQSEVNFSLSEIRGEGARGCGFTNLPPQSASQPLGNANGFVEETMEEAHQPLKTRKRKEAPEDDTVDLLKLMELILRRSRRRTELHPNTNSQDNTTANGTALSILEWSEKPELTLDNEQKMAFQAITAAFTLTYYNRATIMQDSRLQDNENMQSSMMRRAFRREKKLLIRMARLNAANESLRMFLDGPGGAGKSRVIEEVVKYGKQLTDNLNMTFDMRTIVVTALSGVAATSIGGETLHAAVGLNKRGKLCEGEWLNTRLLIIDEVSFMNTNNADKLDQNLRQLTGNHTRLYGGLHVVFCGDFCQLEPCSGVPLYSQDLHHKQWQNSINAYIELMGMHRFKDDLQWGHILRRMRAGKITTADINEINKRVISNPELIPQGVAYCVYANSDRTAINAGVFSQMLKTHYNKSDEVPPHLLLMQASNMKRIHKNTKKTPLESGDICHITNSCGDSRVREGTSDQSGNFVDPLLKLYHNAPLMLVKNEDVPNGHANGTRVILQSVKIKQGAPITHAHVDGKTVRLVQASDVNHLECTLDGNPNKVFKVKPKSLNCRAKVPIPKRIGGNAKTAVTFKLEMTQVNVLSNDATTGHKLQGQTKKSLIISTWSNRRNWNYVALSRVKTRCGLFLVKPLSHCADFSVHEDLQTMLTHMRQEKLLQPILWDMETMRNEPLNDHHLPTTP